MSLLKVLIVALMLVAVQAQSDDCLTNSYAPVAVGKVTSLSASLFSGLTTTAQINTALNNLYTISTAITSPFVQNVYVGASNDDFYMIKNCLTQQGPNDYCTQEAQWIAYVRNTAVYGDSVRHVFNILGGTVDVTNNATAQTPETATYSPSTRFWYVTPGWSGLITYASGGQGKTYSATFGTGLVAGADKALMEYCGVCLSNSYAVTVSQVLAIADFSTAKAITSASQFSSVAAILLNAMTAVASPYALNAIVGFSNGDSYMVKMCATSPDTSNCNGTNALFYVTNNAVYGDNTRRAFVLSDSAAVGASAGSVGAYNTTGRTWYMAQNGWSDTYTFTTSSGVGRTYSLSINGGVVGTDRISTEPCNRAYQASSGTTGAAGASSTTATGAAGSSSTTGSPQCVSSDSTTLAASFVYPLLLSLTFFPTSLFSFTVSRLAVLVAAIVF